MNYPFTAKVRKIAANSSGVTIPDYLIKNILEEGKEYQFYVEVTDAS